MKCGNMILIEERRRKGSGKKYEKVTKRFHWTREKIHGISIKEDFPDDHDKFVACDGNIIPTIEMNRGPDDP